MGNRLRSFDSAEGRRGLLEWAAPVIHDRLRDAYERRLGVGGQARALARLHDRVWSALIAGDEANYQRLRHELVVAGGRCGIELASVNVADAEAMAELLDIVVMRFQRCERTAKSYRLALVELAERLVAQSRAA